LTAIAGQCQALAAGRDGNRVPGREPGEFGLGEVHENIGVLAGHVPDRAGRRPGLDPDRVADAGQELQREVRRLVAVPHRRPRLEVVGRVSGRRVPAVHAQRDTAHAGQDERLAVRADPVDVPVGERRPDLTGERLPDQAGRVGRDVHRPGLPPSSGKPAQARVRKDFSKALMVSWTSAPWAKSPWLTGPPPRISVAKSATRQE
jgi:hypothetical protein